MSGTMHDAMLGALVADAISMPVHWYYDTDALDRDYPELDTFRTPHNPHPDSILWRSKYVPLNKDADILHDQAQYWGHRGIHYHQFLPAGGNTINFLLGLQLHRLVVSSGEYAPKEWLELYVELMRTPCWHRDTYVEEYHRAFFENLARGHKPENCGIKDIHIGGLTPVPFLMAALEKIEGVGYEDRVELMQAHLALTHLGQPVAKSGRAFVEILQAIASGQPLRDAIAEHATAFVTAAQLDTWAQLEDRMVVGRHLTTACYLPESFTASLFFAWKYHDDFTAGTIANARCGGDNAHRGAVVGALLGAVNGVPERWLRDLRAIDQICLGRSEVSA